MIFRRAAALAVVGALAFGMAGCVGTPAAKPSTSAPAFASDEEAYKAAEKVYREYVDAYNSVDYSNPGTFEALFGKSSDGTNAADRRAASQAHADKMTKTGTAVVASLERSHISSDRREIELAVCLDVSAVDFRDASGASLVPADRAALQPLAVTLDLVSAGQAFKVAHVVGSEGDGSCH